VFAQKELLQWRVQELDFIHSYQKVYMVVLSDYSTLVCDILLALVLREY
jgi:hypothetical protein